MKITIAFVSKFYWEIVFGFDNDFHSSMCFISIVKWEKLNEQERLLYIDENGEPWYPDGEIPLYHRFYLTHPRYWFS